EGEYTIPLGKAEVKREGTDLTIVTYGAMVHESLKAAEELAKEGHSVEVIDLRTISPLDIETIVSSVEKTGRAIVVQEAQKQAGIASQVVAEISDRAILSLEAPVLRVAAPDTVFAFPQAETVWLPNFKDVMETAKKVLEF
ncbi:MAG TPA: transketolase C-terminal domain-containing protein, partial [Pseudoneobacillus sp.]|nr:transketolase C-terminal domain-containing protein [Pseudoneobacillus sp.]